MIILLLFACQAPKKIEPGTAVVYLEREPLLACREGKVASNHPGYVRVGKTSVAPADVIPRNEAAKPDQWVCVFDNTDFTYGKWVGGAVEAGPNLHGKRATLTGVRTHAVPKAWAEAMVAGQAGLLLREEAAKHVPPKPKDWQPMTNDYVLWRPDPSQPWEAYNVLWDPPLVGDVFRELWQPKNVQVLNKAKLQDVYPFPEPDERPRIEEGDFVMCIVIDANMASHRSSRLGKTLRRNGDMLSVQDEDGGSRRVHASDCLKLR